MGLFDGAAASAGRRGTTADLAAHFDLPVVLVLDVARQAQSAAAIARGFAAHDPAVKIAGVILNRTASISINAPGMAQVSRLTAALPLAAA
jgi:cobyrinic acid a,c-diamide synthase